MTKIVTITLIGDILKDLTVCFKLLVLKRPKIPE